MVSKQVVRALDSWRDSQEAISEAAFLAVYGSPALQAAVGIDPQSSPSRRQEMSAAHREMLDKRIAELTSRIGEGGLREAGIRGLLYVGSARGMVDERSLEALRSLRRSDTGARLTVAEFKMLVREQFFMLLLDQEASAGRDSEVVARQRRRPADGLRRDPRSPVRQRRDLRRGRQASQACRRAVRRRCAGIEGGRLECRPLRSEGEGIVTPVRSERTCRCLASDDRL